MSSMMKFVVDETRSVESITNFTLKESMNTISMQLNNELKKIDTCSQEFIQLLFFALQNAEVIERTIITSKDP